MSPWAPQPTTRQTRSFGKIVCSLVLVVSFHLATFTPTGRLMLVTNERTCPSQRQIMRTGISAIYTEFTDALTEVLAENGVGPARRGRRPRACAASNLLH
jgi:hypothetical protein